MDAFATLDDLVALCPQAADGNEERAGALLPLASAAIAALADTSAADEGVLKLVCCSMVARALQSGGAGVSQESWGASPYSGSVTYANPSGDLYLTSFEKRLLGVDEPEALWANQAPGGEEAGGV